MTHQAVAQLRRRFLDAYHKATVSMRGSGSAAPGHTQLLALWTSPAARALHPCNVHTFALHLACVVAAAQVRQRRGMCGTVCRVLGNSLAVLVPPGRRRVCVCHACPAVCMHLCAQVGDTASKLKHSAAALTCLQKVAPAAVMQVASLATMHAATLVRLLRDHDGGGVDGSRGASASSVGFPGANVGAAAAAAAASRARAAGDVSLAAAMQAAGNARNVLALVYGEQHPRTKQAVQLYRMLATGR